MAIDIWIGVTNAWATTTNWSLGAAPVNTNDVYLQNSSQAIATFDASAVTGNSFNADMSYTGLVGLGSGTSASDYLQFGATTFNLGTPSIAGGNGSRRMNLNIANSGAIVNVFGSGASANDSGYAPVRLLGTALVLNCMGGITGTAMIPSETASVATLTMQQGGGAPTLYNGRGCTVTTANIYAGTMYDLSVNTLATLNLRQNGAYYHQGTGAITTANIGSRTTMYYPGSGTITTLNLTGTLDMTTGNTAVTVTNCNLYAGAKIVDPGHRITFTNPATLVQCKLTDVSLDEGFGRTIQFA